MIRDEIKYDINVTNAFKNYGRCNILNGLELKVEACTIYGILGSSGCGKSTLLKCILGIMKLDSGCIKLNAESIKEVGYMPQNLCLEKTLSIKEIFEYFGALYNMSKRQIENRIHEINRFLLLPNLNRFINDISGGQSRKVSLAISLLHDPKVLILDEPTVGIDLLLKYEIWAEFKKMVNEHQKTIIVSTHYLEEAREAHTVGFMRNGKIIEEGSPQNILVKYGVDTLEVAFLKLCCNKEENQIINNEINQSGRENKKPQTSMLKQLDNNIKLYRINALTKKNFQLCCRDYVFISIVILLPIFQSFNFGIAIGVDFKGMSIAVKNDETNFLDCHLSNTNGCIFDEGRNQTMSCVVINYLASHNYLITEVIDRNDGEKRMNNSMYMAFIYFPKNYTEDLVKYINDREHFDLESRAYAHLTMGNFLFRNQIIMDVFKSINYLYKEILSGCSNNPKIMNIPINFNTLYGNEIKTYSNSIVNLFIAM